jgi:predicted Rossmann fold flavoprotein
MQRFDCIVIGAGAAGLYCAMHAGRRGRRVLVLEHNAAPGAKILISGGGRCNFTNLNAGDPLRYLSANPHFARSALTRHPPAQFLALIEKHRIAVYEKTLGQLFCEGARAARRIVEMLMRECSEAGATVRVGARVAGVERGERFVVATDSGAFEAASLVIASGGLSIPKLGATPLAYDIARQFRLKVIPTRPGLAPLTFAPADLAWMQPLSGVSADVIARARTASFREAALFTHRGLSGPAILQASSYLDAGAPLGIDWLPDVDEAVLVGRKRARPKAQIKAILSELLPERLAATFSEKLPRGALGDIKDADLIAAGRALKASVLRPAGSEGYAKAEVTVGGVDTDALSQQNMEARAAPGLYFIGEAVDVTGWLGGYNFQWAWSSGWAAGQSC